MENKKVGLHHSTCKELTNIVRELFKKPSNTVTKEIELAAIQYQAQGCNKK